MIIVMLLNTIMRIFLIVIFTQHSFFFHVVIGFPAFSMCFLHCHMFDCFVLFCSVHVILMMIMQLSHIRFVTRVVGVVAVGASIVFDVFHFFISCSSPHLSDGEDSLLIVGFNCVMFGKLSCFLRALLLAQKQSRPLWNSLSETDFILTTITLTTAFTDTPVLHVIVLLCSFVISIFPVLKSFIHHCFSHCLVDDDDDDDGNDKKILKSRYVKFVFDLSDSDLLSRNDCHVLLSKLGTALQKIHQAKSLLMASREMESDPVPERCVICMEEFNDGINASTTTMCVLQPCGHVVLCSECAITIRQLSLLCPCCRLPCYSCSPYHRHKEHE